MWQKPNVEEDPKEWLLATVTVFLRGLATIGDGSLASLAECCNMGLVWSFAALAFTPPRKASPDAALPSKQQRGKDAATLHTPL